MKKNIIIIVLSLFIITAGILALRFLFGENEDAWICENGEWVKHGNPSAEKPNMPCGEDKKNEPDNKEEEEENEEKNITVDAPSAGETVNFPFKISGRARVFENIVRVELREKEGEELYEGIAYANSPDIGQFGPFEKEINFLTKEPEGEDVILDVFWDSPKDGSRLDNVSMPLKLAVGETSSVKVYFNREEFDSQNSCDKVGYVERIIPKTKASARAAIELLLGGATEKEVKKY